MRYFLASLITGGTRDFARDFRGSLTNYKRNLEFYDLDTLFMSFKYLGESFRPHELQDLEEELRSFLAAGKLTPFQLEAPKIVFGKSGELRPQKIELTVKSTAELRQLAGILHERAVSALGSETSRFREPAYLLGKVVLARIKGNISQPQQRELTEKLTQLTPPEAIVLDNFAVLHSELVRSKRQVKIDFRIDLPK